MPSDQRPNRNQRPARPGKQPQKPAAPKKPAAKKPPRKPAPQPSPLAARPRTPTRAEARRSALRQKALYTAGGCVAIFAVVVVACVLMVRGPRPVTPDDAPSSAPANAEADSVAEAVPTEEEQRIAVATATASQNVNEGGAAPTLTDPDTWNQRGKEIIDGLMADPYYADECGLKVDKKGDDYPYFIAVNRVASTVTVYTLDEEDRYTVPYMAMVCSGGDNTPTGFYATPETHDWRLLEGNVYGQYATRIYESILFHSVPYYTQHQDDLEYDEFNKLGSLASLGCIRLAVVDTKWIYDNCPVGTRVVIYDDAETPGPMGKPGTIHIDPADETLRGWDPTDPNPENPWDDKYLSGTAIRSDAAWEEWNAAQADGRWNGNLNATDLQGHSTDSSVEGTRG